MGLNRDALTVFHKKWFSSATPVNAVKGTNILTLDGVPVAEEMVTIGTEVYEFVAAAEDIAVATNIPVVLGVTLTADNAVTKLAAAINANSSLVTAVADTDDDTVTLTAKLVGTEGNSIATTTDMTNGAFDEDTLLGGLYATPCKATNALIEIGGVKYYTTKPATKWTEDAWYSIAETAL